MTYDEWRTSDEILDTAKEGLTFFADFIPVYNQACAVVGGGRYAGLSYANDIQRPFDELRGIDFSMLRADAEHLRAAVETAENHQHNLDRYWGSLGGWTGTASSAARAHHDRFNGMASGFLQAAGPVPAVITGAVRHIQDTLVRYTDNLIALADQKCGGMTPEEVRGAIRTAQGDIEGMESAQFLSKVLDVSSGFVTFGAGWLLDYFGYGASDQIEELRQELMRTAREALQNFIAEFDAKKSAFDAYTRSAGMAIQRDYDTMLAGMRPLTVEAFKELPDPRNFQETTPAGALQGTHRPPPVPTGAGTTPSGTGVAPGGTPSRPPTTGPSGTPATQPTQPTGTVPQVPPVTTQPPTTQRPPGQQPRPVTIPTGNGSITVAPPDAQGRVRLTTTDGAGAQKNYDLDFSRGTSAAGANPVTPGVVPPVPPPAGGGVPAPGSPGMGGISPISPIGTGRPGSPGSGGPTTPTPRLPSTMFPWTDKPAPGLTPDEEGKVTIRDGDVTITVEADELTDQLKITLDDGHGHTTSYSVDYKDPAHPTVREGADLEPHMFGPTGSTPPPSQSSFVPSSASPASIGHIGGGGGGGGGGFAGAGAVSGGPGGGGFGSGGQMEPGAYSGQSGAGAPAAATTPAAASAGTPGQSGGGGMMGGMPMMGGMGAGAGGGEDKERGTNKWLGKEDVFSDDPAQKRRAVKAGGVIGEDKKK